MVRTALLATSLSFSLVAAYPVSAAGQEGQTRTTQADTAQAQARPAAIPAADVVVRAEETNASLRQLRARAAADPDIEALSERIPEILTVRDGLVADSASQDPTGATRRALLTLRERWTRYKEQLDNWQSTLVDRSEELGAAQDSLAQTVEVWQVTADTAAEAEYPEVAVQTIASIRSEIEDVAAAIRERVDSVLTLQNQVVELSSEAAEVLARIEATEGAARLGLLRPKQPPIWTALTSEQDRVSWADALEIVRRDLGSIASFIEDSAEDFVVQIVVLFVFMTLVILLGRRAKESTIDDPDIAVAAGLFTRPFSATVLIFLLTMRLFHPTIPIAFLEFGSLLALIPLLRLLPMLLPPRLRPPLYVFAALWLLHASANLLPDGSPPQRLMLLVVTVVSLVAFVWYVRREGKAESQGTLQDITRRLVGTGAVLLAISSLANVFGYVDLAALLTRATLGSVLLAGAVYTGALVILLLLWLLMRTKPAQAIASIRFNTHLLGRRMKTVVKVGSIAAWIAWVLNGFDLLRPVYDAVVWVLKATLSVGSVSISLGNVLAFFLAIWIATLAARFTKFVLDADVLPHLTLPRGVPGAITKVTTYVIIGLGLVTAVAAAGIDLSNIALLAGALGVGIGFGLQNIVSNFVSGLILIFERPIQVGDSVQLDTLSGSVKNIGIRASTVRTWEGAEVLVPNADLIAGRVVNWTLSDRLRRLDIQVGVSYGSDPHKVKEVLLDTLEHNPDCLTSPEPYILFKGFGDSSLDFELRFWTGNFDNWLTIKSEATFAVHDALKEAGIEIPFPQRDLHVRSVDPSVSGTVPNALHAGQPGIPANPDPEQVTDA